ncbi:MAG: 50S ribosomal protein L11 methyltransferase [Pseudomonadota bacterium]
MSGFKATIACPSAAVAEAVADALAETCDAVSWEASHDTGPFAPPAGSSASDTDISTKPWLVAAYFAKRPGDAQLAPGLAARAMHGADLPDPVIEALPGDRDWVRLSQEGLAPVTAGGFVIHGGHDRDAVPLDADRIEIEAGPAFGTAHHGTTTGCLVAIDALSRMSIADNVKAILDLGTGTGILAIAARRRFPHARIVASDIDAVSVQVAEENAHKNGVKDVAFVVGDGVHADEIVSVGPYDLIIANILAGPLIEMAPSIVGALAQTTRARIILSGLLTHQSAAVGDAYRAAGAAILAEDEREGWATLTLGRVG